MKYNAFSDVLSDVILKRNIEAEYKYIQTLDKDDKYKIRCEFIGNDIAFQSYKLFLYKRYIHRRDKLKKSIKMIDERDVVNPSLIDAHKIAAVFLYSILDLKPIKFSLHNVKKVDDIPDSIKLVNYRIAFKTACGVIFADMLDAVENVKSDNVEVIKNKERVKAQLIENGELILPKTRTGLSSYLDNYAKILYIGDRVKKDPSDYLEIADTMFLLECFNRNLLDFHFDKNT